MINIFDKKTISGYVEIMRLELESLDRIKDQFLFFYVKKYWPRNVLPNHLTWTRVVIGILLFILLFNFKNTNGLVIFPLFLLGALTDLFDGVVARSLNLKTKLGEFLDPVADRILLIPIFMYTIIDFKLLLSAIIFFEAVNAGIALFVQDKPIPAAPNIFGKTKMVLQSVVLVAILLFWPQIPNAFFLSLLWLSVVCIALSVILKVFEVRWYYAKGALPIQHAFAKKGAIPAFKGQKG